ncbi:MAG: rhomboid family intramembrane serine protease [Caldilineaceae bacterium]|nr:rhomboid family intramembrane serine protease [Caldilineaceae bacterium]
MIPLNDLNPTRRLPLLTWALIIINVLVFLWEASLSESALFQIFTQISVVPAQVAAAPFSLETQLDILRSMFLHGSWLHLIGNMLYLYLFGDNVEDRFGRPLFLLLYVVCGYAAVVAQVLIDATSTIPLVGASGAIAGVLGSYLVLFPGVRVRGIIPLGFFSQLAEWPAWVVLLLWFGLQLFSGLTSLGPQMEGGVAFFAHIGGFVFGALLTLPLLAMPQPSADERNEMLYQRARRYRY